MGHEAPPATERREPSHLTRVDWATRRPAIVGAGAFRAAILEPAGR